MSDLHRFCKMCGIATNELVCSKCGHETEEDMPIEIHWCPSCSVPVIQSVNQADKGYCPLCGRKMKYLSTDLRPVFPEERLLVELILKKKPHELINSSVWAENNRYYIDGKSTPISTARFQEADADWLSAKLAANRETNSYEKFNKDIDVFIRANQTRLHYLKDTALRFVNEVAARFDEERIMISFSGGKDSTATADVVTKALGNPSLVHVFGDTTLEFPATIEYAERYRADHPQAIFIFCEMKIKCLLMSVRI